MGIKQTLKRRTAFSDYSLRLQARAGETWQRKANTPQTQALNSSNFMSASSYYGYNPRGPLGALSVPAVYRAINILQNAVGQLTLDAWENGRPVDVENELRLIYRPDPRQTLSQFLQITVYALAVTGDAYWLVNRDAQDNITSLQVLNGELCAPWLDETGTPFTTFNGKDYPQRELYHLIKSPRPWHPRGLSPLEAARQTLTNSLALEEYAARVAASGEVPSGLLKMSPSMAASQEELEKYRDLWNARPPGVAILQPGVEYEKISLSPRDLQFIESRNYNILDIARLYGIPPKMLLISPEGGTDTYSNLQDEDLAFLKWTLSEYTRLIEEALTWLLPMRYSVRFNIDAFLRPATLQRYQAHEIAARAGFKTINEIRADEGLPPLNQGGTENGN